MTLRQFDNPSASDIGSGLVPVPPAIKASDVAAVRKDYGIAASFKPKGQSDSSLYSHSVKFVLDWWKRKQVTDAGKGTTPGSSGSGSGSASGGKAGAGSASGSSAMPNTAMGTSQGPANILPHIQSGQEKQAQALGTQRGAQNASRSTGIKSTVQPQSYPSTSTAIAGTVSRATAQSILTQMGLRAATPPAAALTSAVALRAWAQSQLKGRQQASRAGV